METTMEDRNSMPIQKVRIIMAKSIRNLIIPRPEGLESSITIDAKEFERIKKNSIIQKHSAEDEAAKLAKELEVKMERRKRQQDMKRIDLQRQQRNQFTDIEEEAVKNATAILSNATEKMQESDDNIKAFNQMINTAKCNAILDAQCEEKKKIAELIKNEERVLDHCSEAARQKAIKEMEESDEIAKQKRLRVAAHIRKQISERELMKIFELDQKDQENVQMRKEYAKMIEEDEAELMKRAKKKVEYRAALKEVNDALLDLKKKAKEREKAEELKIWEFQKRKADRERAVEREEEEKKKEKEMAIARLRAMQEQSIDEVAERQTIQARREHEEKERQWLENEQESAKKKKERDKEMSEARHKQMEMKEHMLYEQAIRDKKDFENILRYQRYLMEKERQTKKEEYERNIAIAKDIREQMRAKEQLLIHRKQKSYEEAEQEKEYARLYRQRLREIKEKKFHELRKVGIPDKYLEKLERDLQLMKKVEENMYR